MKLTGITLISNGDNLKYPYKECISNLCEQCDEVIVNVDTKSIDNTYLEVLKLQSIYNNLYILPAVWDLKNTGDGKELAIQANHAVRQATGDWILYLQADELLLNKHVEELKEVIRRLDEKENYTQLELWRTYFYGDLQTRLMKDELYLGRIFKKGTHEVGGDGMYLIRKSGRVLRTDYPIFHYSRIGTEQEITQRIRTLDKMFHEQKTIDTFEDFKYTKFFGLKKYWGPHPEGIKEFYGEKRT